MRAQRKALIVLVFSAIAVVGLAATAAQAQGGKPEVKSAEAFGIIWDHGNGNANGKRPHGGSSPNLTWHGGRVQHGTTNVYPIYWGSSWTSPGDKITGLKTFYSGVGGSMYANTNTEYNDGSGNVSSSVSFASDVTDLSAAPSRAPSTTDVLNEVAKLYPQPIAYAYYPVYIDQPRGNAGYCAWHSSGTIGGVPVQFAFFFKLDNDPGCDPQSSAPHSQGLNALANVTGHELSEMLTDPQLNAWFDSAGSENADKCAWTFGSSLLTFRNGSQWKIQGNWSNAAYNRGAGYIPGCIDGN